MFWRRRKATSARCLSSILVDRRREVEAFIRVVSNGSVVFIGGPAREIPDVLKTTMRRFYTSYPSCTGGQLAAQICRDCVYESGENAVLASVAGRGAWVIHVDADAHTVKFRSSQFAFTFEEFAALNMDFLRGFDWNDGIIDDLAVVGYSNHPYYRERLHKIKRMLEAGRSVADVATALGVSIDVVRKEIIDHMKRSKRK